MKYQTETGNTPQRVRERERERESQERWRRDADGG